VRTLVPVGHPVTPGAGQANGLWYRNRENFRNAIYFHLGGLDLYPETLKSAHPKA
jgi:hypothetical protein